MSWLCVFIWEHKNNLHATGNTISDASSGTVCVITDLKSYYVHHMLKTPKTDGNNELTVHELWQASDILDCLWTMNSWCFLQRTFNKTKKWMVKKFISKHCSLLCRVSRFLSLQRNFNSNKKGRIPGCSRRWHSSAVGISFSAINERGTGTVVKQMHKEV
jgi:hypothetical protein